ncbi:MAG: hypothetical protein SFV32_13485 [Opitutaceae bacterium]|nr:hypothetical protein [Opitutaceae bacterium]
MKTHQVSKSNRAFPGAVLTSSLILVALSLAGCSSGPESHVVSAPPPPTAPVSTAAVPTATVATSGSGTPSATATAPVIITHQPPVPQTETVLAQPTSDHVWIPGYWHYRDSRYVWIAGRWEVPPHHDAVWVSPRWEKEENGYRYYEGYWR